MDSIVQAVYKNSIRFPDKPALIYGGVTVSYKKLFCKIYAFSAAVKAKKIRKGSKIAVEADNLILYFTAILGSQLAKCVPIPLQRNITRSGLQKIIDTINPAVVFSHHSTERLDSYFNDSVSVPKNISFPNPDDLSSIFSTTGTTGKPEMIVHTIKSTKACIENLTEGTDIDSDSVLLVCAPFNLSFGCRRVLAALYAGATVAAVHSIRPINEFFAVALQNKVNYLALIPSDFSNLLNADEDKIELISDRLKYVQTATSLVSRKDKNEFLKRCPDVTLYNVYGATESGCVAINNCSKNKKDNCLGKSAVNAQIVLFDENGKQIERCGEYGYIAVKGDMNMKCYYKKRYLTDKVMKDDFIVTSDIAYFDQEGDLIFVSRVGDIINAGGYKIIPEEIENIALEFPSVKECACVAQKDSQYGEIPQIFVVFKDETASEAKQLHSFMLEKLSSYKVPVSIRPIDKIPHSLNGKVMRRLLSMID